MKKHPVSLALTKSRRMAIAPLRNEIARRSLAAVTRTQPIISIRALTLLSRVAASADVFKDWQADRYGDAPGFASNTDTLDFLRTKILELQPGVVLELGSGASTVAIAEAMREVHGARYNGVFSIDEDEGFLRETRAQLDSRGLTADLVHRPLRAATVNRRTSLCYDLNPGFMREWLADALPDFLFIDGPSGRGNARLATLPLLQPHLREECVFFLDDALRDDEIAVAKEWARLERVEIVGVHPVGRGILEGLASK